MTSTSKTARDLHFEIKAMVAAAGGTVPAFVPPLPHRFTPMPGSDPDEAT